MLYAPLRRFLRSLDRVSAMPSSPETLARRLRIARGTLSQDEFASRMAVHKETLGKYERGARQPDSEFLVRLHDTFEVSLDWLATGEGPMLVSGRDQGQTRPVQPTAPGGQPILDERLMSVVISSTESWLGDQGLEVTPDEKAKLLLAIYRLMLRKRAEVTDKESLSSRVKEIVSDLIGSFLGA